MRTTLDIADDLLASRQITDACLPALAHANAGCRLRFDRGISTCGVAGAQEKHLTTVN